MTHIMQHKSQTKLTQTNNLNPDLKIKSGKIDFPILHFLEDDIEYFVLSFVVKIAEIIMKTISMFYPTTSPIYVTITYPRSKAETTGFLLTFPDIVF